MCTRPSGAACASATNPLHIPNTFDTHSEHSFGRNNAATGLHLATPLLGNTFRTHTKHIPNTFAARKQAAYVIYHYIRTKRKTYAMRCITEEKSLGRQDEETHS
jgi:hypothetical protein